MSKNVQNPSVRRAYLIRGRPELRVQLESWGLTEDAEFLCRPTVVMTDALPFEGKMEGYRASILRKCKQAFLEDLVKYEPLLDESRRALLLGTVADEGAFDRWWIAEEVETLEIETAW